VGIAGAARLKSTVVVADPRGVGDHILKQVLVSLAVQGREMSTAENACELSLALAQSIIEEGVKRWVAGVVRADSADVRLGSVACSIVPVVAAVPGLGAVLVAGAVAPRLTVLPVVRLAVGPVLVVRRGAISPHE